MRIDDIEALLAVVQFSSLSQAAEHLGITQSAITRRLQSLEQALGAQLLDRQTKPLRLTTVGQRVYQQCLTLKRETRRLYALANSDGEARGPLRLGLPQSLSELSLAPLLAGLRHHSPQADVTVSCGWGGQLLQRMENLDLDAMLTIGPASLTVAGHLRAERITPLEIVVIARKGMFNPNVSLGEAARSGWVLNPEGCGLRAGIIRYLEQQGCPLKVNAESVGAYLQAELVAAGAGLGILPRGVADSSPQHNHIEVIAAEEYCPESFLWLIYAPEPGNLLPAIREFARLVAEQMP